MKKGFTLIELLAVIVILSIIALIATPVILNIIEDSRDSSYQRSIDIYLKAVQNAIMEKNMQSHFSPEQCVIENRNLSCDGIRLDVVENGMPDNGKIFFSDNNKIVYYKLTYNNKEYKKSTDDNLIPSSIIKSKSYYIESQKKYLFARDEDNGIVYDESFGNMNIVGIVYDNTIYAWLPTEKDAEVANSYTGRDYLKMHWYYGSYNDRNPDMAALQTYEGDCPIDINTFSISDDDIRDYVERIILSFNN